MIESKKSTGKFSLEEFFAMKDHDLCKCQEEPLIYINPVIFERNVEERPFDGFRRGKGKYNNKGSYHNNRRNDNYHKRGGRHHGKYNDNNRHHRNQRNGGGFVRNPISEATKEMKEKASSYKGYLNKVDKEDVELRAKAILNRISPDNIKSQREKFYSVLKD